MSHPIVWVDWVDGQPITWFRVEVDYEKERRAQRALIAGYRKKLKDLKRPKRRKR